GERDIMPHPGLGFRGQEVARRFVEELHHGRIFPGWRVRNVDNDLSTDHRVSQPLAGYGVDTRLGRCRHRLMAALSQLLAQLRSDESTATNNYNLHVRSPCLAPLNRADRSAETYANLSNTTAYESQPADLQGGLSALVGWTAHFVVELL